MGSQGGAGVTAAQIYGTDYECRKCGHEFEYQCIKVLNRPHEDLKPVPMKDGHVVCPKCDSQLVTVEGHHGQSVHDKGQLLVWQEEEVDVSQ